MKRMYLFALFSAMLLVGCTEAVQNDVQTPTSVKVESVETPSYVIPIEQALASLEGALTTLNPQREKQGLPKLLISNMQECLVANRATCMTANTRKRMPAADPTTLQDTILYIVNFPDSSGYAILSADERIEDEVLMIADKGNLSLEEFMTPIDSNIIDDGMDYFIDASFANDLIKKHSLTELIQAPTIPPIPMDYGIIYGEWSTNYTILPLVSVEWHQGEPFNDACPICPVCLEPSYAGCAAIAVAQIFAANQNVTKLNGVTISRADWQRIVTHPSGPSDSSDKNKIAQWIRSIGDECSMEYHNCNNGTHSAATNIYSVANFLNTLKPLYNNVDVKEEYDSTAIFSMLRAQKPVYIRASGHAWVIDGLCQQQRTQYCVTGTDTASAISKTICHRNLVHCNYGWQNGQGNGYYVSQIFNIKQGPINPNTNNYTPQTLDFFFNDGYKIITYNLQHYQVL